MRGELAIVISCFEEFSGPVPLMHRTCFVCADRYKIKLQEAAEEALAAKSIEVYVLHFTY
jgi:hypothetical protein